MSAQPMSKAIRTHDILQRIAVVVLALGLIVGMALPFAGPAQAAEVQKVVRVGWYDSSFCYFDEAGRRCARAASSSPVAWPNTRTM